MWMEKLQILKIIIVFEENVIKIEIKLKGKTSK